MKKIISLLLVFTMFLSGCGLKNANSNNTQLPSSNEESSDSNNLATEEINFPTLDDEELLNYIESNVYSKLIDKLDSDKYFIENISTKYISKEYLEEVAYNSQANIYFGFTLEELEEQFDGSKFIFTLGDDGKTTVKEFEAYDDTYDKVIRNVVTGAGVVLVSATISATTGGLSPAVSVIFAASAKTGTVVGLSDGVISGVIAGVVNGIQTKDFDSALDAAALAGSDGFKWGAFSGVVLGGSTKALEIDNLKHLTVNGLSLKHADKIKTHSGYPDDIIRKFHSIDEYYVYKSSKLKPKVINGKSALVQEIDWNFIGDVEDGRTNAQRVREGLAPLDPSGNPYNLHHIGQNDDSPLAILTSKQHTDNNGILHENTGTSESNIDRNEFAKDRRKFWSELLEMDMGGI